MFLVARRFLVGLLVAGMGPLGGMAWAVGAAAVGGPAPAAAGDSPATSSSLNIPVEVAPPPPNIDVDKLLEDPYPARPEIAEVLETRRALAREGADVAAFEKAAAKLASQKAWDSAVGLLWWAEKMTNDKPERENLNKLMVGYIADAHQLEGDIDAAMQLQAAGRPDEALKQLIEIRKDNPLSPGAHFNIGKLHMGAYEHEDDRATSAGLAVDLRERVFHVVYREFSYALALNPFYIDAYDQLSGARVIFRDHPGFLQRTNDLTERAAAFRTRATPVVKMLEDGDRSTLRLVQAGDALADSGALPYAVFAWRAALFQGGAGWDRAGETQKKIQDALGKM